MIKQEDLDSGKVVINSYGEFHFKLPGVNVIESGWPIFENLHRENDLPAVIWKSGAKYWYENGKMHRIGNSAQEWSDGTQYWYIHGKQYTKEEYDKEVSKLKKDKMIKQEDLDSGKVVINSQGTFYFTEDMPRDSARMWSDGFPIVQFLHRLDGPAVVWHTGTEEWWINGGSYDKEEYDKEVSKLNKKVENMITMKQWLELVNFEITCGEKHQWACYGPYAFILDSADLQGDTTCNSSIVFDLVSQEVYEVNVHDFTKGNAYRLITESKREAHNSEAVARGINANQAWDNVNYVDLELLSDFMEKANAIKDGKEYDTTVSIPIDIPDDLLLHCMKQAHEENMTFNNWMAKVLKEFSDRVVAGEITKEKAKAWLNA